MSNDAKGDAWISDTVGALCDPIIVMPGAGWEELPDWIKPRITIERMLENNLAAKEGRVVRGTDAEATAYLYTASLSIPLSKDWSQIYFYVCGKELVEVSGGPLPEGITQVETLSRHQFDELAKLQKWIYEQRVKHRQSNRHGSHGADFF